MFPSIREKLHSFLAAGVLLAASTVFAQSNFFLITRDYYIGLDQLETTSNPADFTISGSPAAIKASAFGFDCYFAGPGGTNLTVGDYPNAVHYPSNGSSPGLDVLNPGIQWICGTDCGGFQIKELHTDDNGQVDRLWLTFSNQCNCSTSGQIRGEIRFNSQLADLAVLYLDCPTNAVVNAPYGHNSTVVTYPAPEGTPGAWIDCQPPSGSVFSAGTNVVVTHFLYGTNAMTCSFVVTVQVAPFTIATLQKQPDFPVYQAPGHLQLWGIATTDASDSIVSITFLSSTNVLAVVANPLIIAGSDNGYAASYWLGNLPAGYHPFQVIAQNSSGLLGTSAVVNLTVSTNLVQNGGFETGDFTDWTLAGTPGNYNFVPWTPGLVTHWGLYGAYLGDIQVATLSQSLPTIPGQYYLLSLWMDNPVTGTNQFFGVNWNTNRVATNVVLNIVAPPTLPWTKLQALVLATGTNTTLQIQARNDPGYFGLDDISVTPVPVPSMQASAILENRLQLSWLTAPGVSYQVQYKTSLLQPGWSNLCPAFVATGDGSTLLDTNSGNPSQRFYRLVLP